MSYQVLTGVWTDWGRGKIIGATLTLSGRNGGILLSFIAAAVTVTASRLWQILCFAAHQVRAQRRPADGLHHQRQNILRNSSSPAGAAWGFLLQMWYWRRHPNAPVIRSGLWVLWAVGYTAIWILLALFASTVSNEASEFRLLQGRTCGIWSPSSSDPSEASFQFQRKEVQDVATAARYARTCYQDAATSPECNLFPAQTLPWAATTEFGCPFPDPNYCMEGVAFRMAAGPIDSHLHLGINAPPSDRVWYKREAICAPVPTTSHGILLNSSDLGPMAQYHYGPILGLTDFTYNYQGLLVRSDVGYTVSSQESWAPHLPRDGLWLPSQGLRSWDSDVSIYFIAFNGIRFLEPCDDPVFAAHYLMDSVVDWPSTIDNPPPGYESDRMVSVMACTEQHQICNPVNGSCTPGMGKHQLSTAASTLRFVSELGLSDVQAATAFRIASAVPYTSLKKMVYTRQHTALRAQDRLNGWLQLFLPPTQWETEVSSWFQDGLALLQHLSQEFATGRLVDPDLEGQIWAPTRDSNYTWTRALAEQCLGQRVKNTQGTLSFSILGIAVIFSFVGLILLTSCILEPITDYVRSKHPSRKGAYKQLTWAMDHHLQMQRLLFEKGASEEGQYGLWTDSPGQSIPTTQTGRIDGSKFVWDPESMLVAAEPLSPLSSADMGIDAASATSKTPAKPATLAEEEASTQANPQRKAGEGDAVVKEAPTVPGG